MPKSYLCIDLKSFYASVECVERGLDPMTTKLVVADPDRSKNTICLAITPAMKLLGIKNRCRINDIPESLDYIVAPPRMQLYIDYAAKIYGIYLSYISKNDIHVYSIDEAFLDVTDYLSMYHCTPRQLGVKIMDDIKDKLGIRATCGIGTNLYLTKIALDIVSKHDKNFIGELDEESYRKKLWKHKPLTDFWRIGPGTQRRLASYGLLTMEDVAKCNEDILYKAFGIDAEILIDHAWGREPVGMKDIKSYHSKTNSLSNGQVLMRDYEYEEGLLVVKEMADILCLELVEKNLVTKSMSLYVGYSNSAFVGGAASNGTISFREETNSDMLMVPAIEQLYRKIVSPQYPIRRVSICCNNVIKEEFHQYDLFTDFGLIEKNRKAQRAAIDVKRKYGKNAILKGMNLEEGAMTIERNMQIGGHKSGTS